MRAGNPVVTSADYPKVSIPLIHSQELANLSQHKILLIDIRPNAHFNKGHIEHALNIDLEILQEQLGRLSANKTIVLIDHKGKLTLTTGRFLASRGFNDLLRLDGGFNAWVKNGHPVVKGAE